MAHTGCLMTMKLYDLTYIRESTRNCSYHFGSDELTWGCRHHMFILTLNNKLFLAPIENPKRIMDVGTGIGIWASYGIQSSVRDCLTDIS